MFLLPVDKQVKLYRYLIRLIEVERQKDIPQYNSHLSSTLHKVLVILLGHLHLHFYNVVLK